jgi:hypothetical protein
VAVAFMCGTNQGGFVDPAVAGPGAPLLAICSGALELGAAPALALGAGTAPASGGVYGALMWGASGGGVAVPASGSMYGALMWMLSGGS